MAGQIKIRIGATKDRSVDVVFSEIEKRGQRAAQNIAKNMRDALGGGKVSGSGVGGSDPVSQAKNNNEKISAETKKRIAKEMMYEKSAHRERLFWQRREMLERVRQERAAQRAAFNERRSFARRTSHRATRFLMPNAPLGSIAARTGTGLMRGLGVDADVSSMVSRSVSLEKQAVAISNAGYLPQSEGVNSKRVDPNDLVKDARAVSDKWGVDASSALDALAGFAGIAGDLDLGRKMLSDMAKLAAATGTELGDMASAAANMANQLDDGPDKVKQIYEGMKIFAGQGKLGAVEIEHLAKQMPRVVASARKFEGDALSNMGKLGALAQLARATGGAPSAAEAARAVAGFGNTLQKSARIDAFKGMGVNVFADKGKTKFKDPVKLIEESLMATGGNLQKMNKLFMDVVGARAVGGLAQSFNDAGGGEAGLAAVRKEIERLTKGASMSEKEIDESANRAANTKAAKGVRLQNKLDDIIEDGLEEILPALEEAAPAMVKFTKAMTELTAWAISNPWEAAWTAIEMSIVRAGLESSLRSVIERVIMNKVGSWNPPGFPGHVSGGPGMPGAPGGLPGAYGPVYGPVQQKSGGWGGKVGGALAFAGTIAFGADAGYRMGQAIAPFVMDGFLEGQKSAIDKAIEKNDVREELVDNLIKKARSEEGLTDDEKGALEAAYSDMTNRLDVSKDRAELGDTEKALVDMVATVAGQGDEVGQRQADEAAMGRLEAKLDVLRDVLSRELKVNVTNMPKPGGSKVDDAGRDSTDSWWNMGGLGRGYGG